ncbi:hypothetical protein EV426DRAFT_698847 [Tirmania nivea]|nr:hypothetical protein EV426DRAFT_698847 [Tirmania nivea]
MPSPSYWYQSLKTEQDARAAILSHILQEKLRRKKRTTSTDIPRKLAKPTKPTDRLSRQGIQRTPQITNLFLISFIPSKVQKCKRSDEKIFAARSPITRTWKIPRPTSAPNCLLSTEMEIDNDDMAMTTWFYPHNPYDEQETPKPDSSWYCASGYNTWKNDDRDGDLEMIDAFDSYHEWRNVSEHDPQHIHRESTCSTGDRDGDLQMLDVINDGDQEVLDDQQEEKKGEPEKIGVSAVVTPISIPFLNTVKGDTTQDETPVSCTDLVAIDDGEFDDELPNVDIAEEERVRKEIAHKIKGQSASSVIDLPTNEAEEVL